MTYSIALQAFAFVLALICIGLMAVVAHYLPAPSGVVRVPRAVRIRVPSSRWPERLLHGGVVCLLVSFVALAITCFMIANA
ncbi:hypothetical protein [Paraburkholderia sp. J12]|uniref:hypothetical protein n=1 Tax=Paraburkholderia sp. J12 TaxID=2805432 RepID=UPI002ABE43D9|nr:hypothetical protein [Paraburkholderia sp. J12]